MTYACQQFSSIFSINKKSHRRISENSNLYNSLFLLSFSLSPISLSLSASLSPSFTLSLSFVLKHNKICKWLKSFPTACMCENHDDICVFLVVKGCFESLWTLRKQELLSVLFVRHPVTFPFRPPQVIVYSPQKYLSNVCV